MCKILGQGINFKIGSFIMSPTGRSTSETGAPPAACAQSRLRKQ